MLNKEGMYFVSFATINWIDIFVRQQYFELICESLNYCIKEKGMVIYCYCIIPSHIYLIFSDNNSNPSMLLGKFKTFTSKKNETANRRKHARKQEGMDTLDDEKSRY